MLRDEIRIEKSIYQGGTIVSLKHHRSGNVVFGGFATEQIKVIEDLGNNVFLLKRSACKYYPHTVYVIIKIKDNRIIEAYDGEFGRKKQNRIEGIKKLKELINKDAK